MRAKTFSQHGAATRIAAVAGCGLLTSVLIASGQDRVVAVKEPVVAVDAGRSIRSSDVKDTVNEAMRYAERAITKAADVGHHVAVSFRTGGGPRTFVLPGRDMKGDDTEQMSEDLAVMTRIFEKAAGQGTQERRAFFNLGDFGPLGRGPEALYLDGFGALFLLSVDYPLVAPEEEKREKTVEPKDRTWEETRAELEGSGSGAQGAVLWQLDGAEKAAEFKAERVEELKSDLVNAFRHASNIKGLRDNDEIVVAVFGPARKFVKEVTTRSGKGKDVRLWDASNGRQLAMLGDGDIGRRSSVMTLRAKKSDVDAFAKEKLSPDEMLRKLEISVR